MIRNSFSLRYPSAFSFFFALLVLISSCAFSPLLHAQLSTTATIAGTVTDATGAIVSNATVTIQNQGTKTNTVLQSNSDGSFIAPGLPVGAYTVSIASPGFQTYTLTGVELHPATTARSMARFSPAPPLLQ